MQKVLNGKALAEYIKERQGRQARALFQADGVQPKLAIVLTGENPVIQTYVGLKKRYGADIGVEVDIHHIKQADAKKVITQLNKDAAVHAIIVQLPLEDTSQTEEIVNLVDPHKDVDGLGAEPQVDPATPMAIMWLLAGYNVELRDKKILLVGRGKLVGAPLERMLKKSGLNVEMIGRVDDLKARTLQADVIITATGSAGLIKADMVKPGAVVVDAGTASEGGKTVGDVAPDLLERDDITITPAKGGVGPLTVCALFENVLRAARPTQQSSPK